jgi:hypothetical protein
MLRQNVKLVIGVRMVWTDHAQLDEMSLVWKYIIIHVLITMGKRLALVEFVLLELIVLKVSGCSSFADSFTMIK